MRIGVFDSGIGGLTVLRELRRRCPGHSTVYLGDTARVPYGAKSPETVRRYALHNAEFLLRQEIDWLVIACNTASAFAMEELTGLPVPVTGVIEPGAELAVRRVRGERIGVLGTAGTVRRGAYERAIQARDRSSSRSSMRVGRKMRSPAPRPRSTWNLGSAKRVPNPAWSSSDARITPCSSRCCVRCLAPRSR